MGDWVGGQWAVDSGQWANGSVPSPWGDGSSIPL